MRSTATDHMKWASSAPTRAQVEGLRALVKEAHKDLDRHEVTLPCGSKLIAGQNREWSVKEQKFVPTGSVGWVIVDGTSGATKTGTLEIGKRL